MKYNKTLFLLLFFIFFIVMINSFFVISLVQNNQVKNAYIINEMGQIRGGIQRYAKLKIFGCNKEKIDEVKNYVDKRFKDITNIYPEIIPFEATNFFRENFSELKQLWNKLVKTDKKSEVYNLSEKNWEIADQLVIYIAKAMENKTEKVLLFIIFISIVSVIATLIIIFIIYNVMNKNLNVKTLKDPLTNLYNFYHLTETLQLLQNRYKRYGKKFALLVVDVDTKDEKKLKDVSKALLNKLRKSDKIFYVKNKFVIVFLEPEHIDLKKASERIEKIIKDIVPIKNLELKIYNGEKIEEII